MAGPSGRANTPTEIAFRGCLGKVQYRSEEHARETRRRCELKRNAWLRIYHCSVCNCWHLARHIGGWPRCGTCLEVFTPRGSEWQCEGCRG